MIYTSALKALGACGQPPRGSGEIHTANQLRLARLSLATPWVENKFDGQPSGTWGRAVAVLNAKPLKFIILLVSTIDLV